jgi:hypothetical protein
MAMKWFLTIFAILALGAAIAGPFFGSLYVSGVALVGFVGLLITANLDRLAEFKASKSGIEAKTREIFARAEVTIDQLQSLAKTVATLSLSLVQRSGRFGGYSDDEQKQIHDETVNVLRRIGVTQSDLDAVLYDWHRMVEFDYAYFILGAHTVPDGLDAAAGSEWTELRSGGVAKTASPLDVQRFLEKYALLSESMRELVEDYQYYCTNKTHRRPEVWRNRAKWGRLSCASKGLIGPPQ